MKNILLLTDFSENANNAIGYALQFFSGSKCVFSILTVQKVSRYTTSDLMSSSTSSSVYDSIIKNPKGVLSDMINGFEKKYKDEAYFFDGICDYDSFLSSVNQVVISKNVDLIVMGTNGATGTKEVIFGSNTLSVVRNVDCPVLVIPENYMFIKPENILFAIEDNEVFESTILDPLVDMITIHMTKLDVLLLKEKLINTEYNKNMKSEIKTFFKDFKYNLHTIVNVPADMAIDCFVQLNKVHIIAKVIHKKSFFNRLFSGSTTGEITYNSKIPLLIMHSN
ncbi:MAG TPA: universal stress protein [Flavobacteriaceae bacterium]|jgi:nucleotide-binding universal stress UspA family protein|nr:universal stress protein [Flavobacteriaceae bacterium]HBS11991.1 universal stress protein [Flavobacteriaceae bacterium]